MEGGDWDGSGMWYEYYNVRGVWDGFVEMDFGIVVV